MQKMIIRVISIVIVLCSNQFESFSQIKTNYERGFSEGYKKGYCYEKKTYSCLAPLEPITPLPRIDENSSNYTQGYNRGFQYGLDLSRSKTGIENSDISLRRTELSFNQYVPQSPLEAMAFVGMIKQKKFNARTDWMQQKIYHLTDIYNTLFEQSNFPNEYNTITHKNNLRKIIVDFANKVAYLDFGDDNVFSGIKRKLNEIENYFYQYYNAQIPVVNEIITKKRESEILREEENNTNSRSNNNLMNEGTLTYFSRFLSKKIGRYDCEISYQVLINGKYVTKSRSSGYLMIEEMKVLFKNGQSQQSERALISEVIDEAQKQYFYRTNYGYVAIDFDFKFVAFYNSDNTDVYVYKIIK
jgi:hypothetical protein